jgi:hypothetical protein
MHCCCQPSTSLTDITLSVAACRIPLTGFTDREAAAGVFKDLGFSVEWKEGDEMLTRHVAPAVVPHPVTGQPVWFNFAHYASPGWTDYADGTPIEPGWF